MTDYCHQEYLKQDNYRMRYQTRFDWYSLGLVLLEIGLWKTLGRMIKEKKCLSPEELLEHILQNYVPRLDFNMGRGYRRVVERCLKGEDIGGGGGGFSSPEEEEEGSNNSNSAGPVRFEFTQTIEEQLASCSL